jgi:hypothetical protein
MPNSMFRPVPEHGWRARVEIYRALGDPEVGATILPFLDEALPRFGVTKYQRDVAYFHESDILEQIRITTKEVYEVTLEKWHALSDEQKMAMPYYYSVLGADVAVSIYDKLVPGAHMRQQGVR